MTLHFHSHVISTTACLASLMGFVVGSLQKKDLAITEKELVNLQEFEGRYIVATMLKEATPSMLSEWGQVQSHR